jgi:MFS family permease
MTGSHGRFGALLARPGGRPQALFGLLGRAPGAMLSVAFVAAAAGAGGEAGYALGGLAAGAYALANAFGGPTVGRLADRLGQREVGRPLALVSAGAALVAVVVLLTLGPNLLLVLLAGVAGATQPNVSAFARVRWAAILDRDDATAAQALESIIDETTFLLGPPLVALLAGVWFEGLPIALAAALLIVGAFGVTSSLALPAVPPHPDAGTGSAWRPEFPAGLGLLFAVLVLGAALGAAQVLVFAYCQALGMEGGAALVYFVNSGASLIGAIVVGGMTWKRPARSRFTISLFVYAAGLLPTALVAGYWPFVLASVVSGIAIAPTFVQANAMVADETPARIRTAAFALLASATGLGIAFGAAVAGQAIALVGGDDARRILVPLALACAVAAVVVDVARRRTAVDAVAPGALLPEDEAPHVPAPAPPPFPPLAHHEDGAGGHAAGDADPA